jgi:hypothetical protein
MPVKCTDDFYYIFCNEKHLVKKLKCSCEVLYEKLNWPYENTWEIFSRPAIYLLLPISAEFLNIFTLNNNCAETVFSHS